MSLVLSVRDAIHIYAGDGYALSLLLRMVVAVLVAWGVMCGGALAVTRRIEG